MVSMNEMAEIVLGFENKQLPIHHIPGPEGVRGRNSDNTLIKEKLGWAPTMKLKVPSQSFEQFSVYTNAHHSS
jgi:GDP-D-mannose 3',5'-epimerase